VCVSVAGNSVNGATHLNAARLCIWGVPILALAGMLIILAGGANHTLFLWLNQIGAVFGEDVWANLTILGDSLVVVALLLPFIGHKPQLIWSAVIAALLAVLWAHGLKVSMGTLRPPAVLEFGSFHLIGPALQSGAFPSGHSTAIFTLAGILCLHLRQAWLSSAILLLAVLVGLSRVMVGVHWPLDILGGALGGWLAALAGTWLAARWPWGTALMAQRVIGMCLLLAALALLVYQHTGYVQAKLLQQIIAVLCLLAGLPGLVPLFRRRDGQFTSLP